MCRRLARAAGGAGAVLGPHESESDADAEIRGREQACKVEAWERRVHFSVARLTGERQ
jgi:hypothetical protein